MTDLLSIQKCGIWKKVKQDIASLDIVGRLPSMVVKPFMPTSENMWLSKYHHNDQH